MFSKLLTMARLFSNLQLEIKASAVAIDVPVWLEKPVGCLKSRAIEWLSSLTTNNSCLNLLLVATFSQNVGW